MTHSLQILLFFLSSLCLAAGEIRIGVPMQPESLFYPIANDHVSDLVTQLVTEPLVETDTKTNKVTGVLASHWKTSKTEVSFTLNPLARFSDGTPVTAQDVQDTFLAFKQKTIPSPEFESQFSTFKEIKIQNKNTVLFRFTKPSPDHLRRFIWLPILHKSVLCEKEKYKKFTHHLWGSGPYLVESVEPGDKITLVKNAAYWDEKAALLQHRYLLNKITVKIIPDYNTQVEMLKNGAIDYLPIFSSKSWNTELKGPLFDTEKIIKAESISKLPYQVSGIVWNMRIPLFQGVKTRTALSHLFPVQKFIKNFFYDSYLPASGIFHPLSDCHDTANSPKEFSPEKAALLLAEDGWKKQEEDGLLYKNGTPFKFNLIVRQPPSLRHLTLYQEELKKSGIQMNLVSLDWVIALNKVRKKDFEAAEYSMDRPLLYSELASQWGSKGTLNYSGLSDPTVDLLLEKLSTEYNTKKQKELCKILDKTISDLQPLSFGWEQVYLRVAYANKFETGNSPFYAYATWRNAFHHWDEKENVP